MPTLPERATSILSVLARHQPPGSYDPAAPHAGDPPPFDWPAIVQAQRPGAKTESQQRQGQRFQRVRADLTQWVEERGLSAEHIEESAFYATVCTAPGTPDGRVLGLALIVFWIYLLDDFLDRRDAASMARAARRAAVPAELASDLRAACAPLGSAARVLGAPRGGEREKATPEARQVARALRDVLALLDAEWSRLPDQRRGAWHAPDRFRRLLVTRQLALCAEAMLREVAWNVAFARDPSGRGLPAFAAYLRNGTVSIGMPAVAATAASFEPRPQEAWQRAYLAVAAGGAVVRLTNDLHTYFADVAEGKMTSVTIRLHGLGFAPAGHDPDTSPEVRGAQTFLSQDLATAVSAFGGGQAGMADGPLALCVRHAVAFALAVYGDGSRHRRDGQAA